MPDAPALLPASEEEIADSLAFGLRYDGRKRVHHADTVMARITAERLVRHLRASGYVLMRRPGAAMPTTSHHGPPQGRQDSRDRQANPDGRSEDRDLGPGTPDGTDP